MDCMGVQQDEHLVAQACVLVGSKHIIPLEEGR